MRDVKKFFKDNIVSVVFALICVGAIIASQQTPFYLINAVVTRLSRYGILVFALIIYAGMYGIENRIDLPPVADFNLYKANESTLRNYRSLPENLDAARRAASASEFVRGCLPEAVVNMYCSR